MSLELFRFKLNILVTIDDTTKIIFIVLTKTHARFRDKNRMQNLCHLDAYEQNASDAFIRNLNVQKRTNC